MKGRTKQEVSIIAIYMIALVVTISIHSYFFMTAPIFTLFIYAYLTETEDFAWPLFSGGNFIVPTLVPISLFSTYSFYVLDGQVFTQRMIGIIVCLLCFGMIAFYVLKNRNKKRNILIGLSLVLMTAWVMHEKSARLDLSWERQKKFNQSFQRL